MSLSELERDESAQAERVGDAATRTLSVAAVENDFVERVYGKLASVYDVIFGPALHGSRVEAIKRIGLRSGDRVLEVGIGTGINTPLYPRDCWVTGIDISASMLEKAQERVAGRQMDNVRLLQMDAATLDFPTNSFDVVYASYMINCVPRPGPGGSRDVPRLSGRRTDHLPQSFLELQPGSSHARSGSSRR